MKYLVATVVSLSWCWAWAGELGGHHFAGDRMGLHGMALFGSGPYYLVHIPTLTPPHNEQLVLRVNLFDSDGERIDLDFDSTPHSLRPTTRFSLDDLIVGKKTSFEADVFQGNFEHKGSSVKLEDSRIEIERVLIARNLVDTDPEFGNAYVIGTGASVYLVNRITGTRPRQEVRKAQLAADLPGQSIDFANTISLTKHDGKLVAALQRAGTRQRTATVEVTSSKRLWCLRAPDFIQPC